MQDSQSQRNRKKSALRFIGFGRERGSLRRVCGGLLSGVVCVSWLLPLSVMPAVAQVAAPECVGADSAGLGFGINGAASPDFASFSVSAIGDLNGDGLPELVVGANYADTSGRNVAGRAYVVFGKSADTNPIDLLNVQLSALPALNSALRGATLTLTGNNLTSVSALTLGGVSVPFARNSSTRLTAVLPANAPATGSFTLSTPLDGTFTTGTFSVPPTPAGAPTISAVTPTTGGPGTRVSVSGTNLAGGTSVGFCNGLRASGRSGSDQVQFTVPGGATSGPVTVTTTNGSYNFLFTVPPSP